MPVQPAVYDVAVIGAGPAGSAAAYFLARGGLRVALLDKFDFPRDKTCGDGLTPRALRMLDEMGMLSRVAQQARRCVDVTVRQSDEITYRLELEHMENTPRDILVLPRLALDDLLRRHAVQAGAQFIPQARVVSVEQAAGARVRLELEGGSVLQATLAIVATGSNTRLPLELGLLKKAPPVNLAARTYFENVEGLDDSIVLFFDGVELPGYGWVFPTGEGTANVGCGVFFDSAIPQPAQLRTLIETHPYLRKLLRNARQVGPIKGYPLRTDFSPAHSGSGRILGVGEALGLVNPITGEGIDYALESSGLAAQAILAGWREGQAPAVIQRNYRAALARKFQLQFRLNHLAQRVYFRPGVFGRFLARAQHKPGLRQAIVDTCFGESRPATLFSPRTLWQAFGW